MLERNIVGEVCYCSKACFYADANDPVERENLVMMENCRSDVLEYVGGEDWVYAGPQCMGSNRWDRGVGTGRGGRV